ncbi:MAG: DUF6504 family protein [Nitriliruptor sp.]
MTKRYRESLDEVVIGDDGGTGDGEADPRGAGAPTSFRWRGRSYVVLQVLGHWREDEGWWRRPDGVPIQLERTDLWRVEAQNGKPTRGVYELVRRGDAWRLDRVWD